MRCNQPFFSIILPTRDRPEQLAQCLAAMAQLDYPHERLEIIAVNDGSQITLENVIEPFRQWLNLKFITQSHSGPAAARNTGAKHANGEFLAFTDDDCAPAPDWLENLAARFAVVPQSIVGGRTINALPDNLYSTASQMLVDYLYAYFNSDPDQATFFTSNNLAVSAAGFRNLGGFDISFRRAAAEDREFCDRWRHHGLRMIYAPEAIVYHMHSLTLLTFCQQHFLYGQGAFQFHRLRAARNLGPLKLEPVKFYQDLLRYRCGSATKIQRLTIPTLLTLSQLANAGGFLWEKIATSHQFTPTEQKLTEPHD